MTEQERSASLASGSENLLPALQKQEFEKKFSDQALSSYLFLSLGMGAVAFALPILLVCFGGYAEHYSISQFYCASETARNVLVGSLWATGTFMFLFHGLSDTENWILNVAGVAAVSVAMNPTGECTGAGTVGGLSLHAASAILFFACLAIVAVFYSKGRVRHIRHVPTQRRFVAAYNLAGLVMIGMPIIIAILQAPDSPQDRTHWIFWIESFGIWAFSFYWFVKTYEYRLLLGIRFLIQVEAPLPETHERAT